MVNATENASGGIGTQAAGSEGLAGAANSIDSTTITGAIASRLEQGANAIAELLRRLMS